MILTLHSLRDSITLMARKRIPATLPPLKSVFPKFTGFTETDIKQNVITDAMRAAAKRFRSQKSRAFYTMRDVAAFFSVPLRTVANAYEKLEHEGILSRIRGSQTMLTGRTLVSRDPVRGVIGLPIWLSTLVLSSFTRRVNMELESRLRNLGFVADLIFHHTKREEAQPDFSERLLLHHLDALVWQNPHPQSQSNLITLHERGVRLLVIQTLEAKTDLPAVIYQQDWSPGIHEIASRWSETGVKNVWIPLSPGNLAYKNEAEIFIEILAGHGLRIETVGTDVSKLPQTGPQGKTRRENALAFVDIATADRFCNREPLAMERLAQFARLALCRGPIRCPYLQHRGVQIEVVAFCPDETARKLAEDIQDLQDIPPGIRHTFQARYWPDNMHEDAFDLS